MSKKLLIFITIICILNGYCLTSAIIAKSNYSSYTIDNDYNMNDYDKYYREFKDEWKLYEYPDLNKNEILKKAKETVPNNFYIFINSKPIIKSAAGITFPLGRLVVVDPSLSNEQYAICCVHEFIHLKYFTCNETFTNFKTFVYLYESDYEFFHKISLKLAMDIFNEKFPSEYNCIGNIIKYMESRNNV